MNPCGSVLMKSMTAMLGVLALAAVGTAPAGVAQAEMLFNGTYTAVQKTAGQPDRVSLWNVTSYCALLACGAHIVDKGVGTDWIFDGTQWSRLAVPQIGMCNGATVPARSAHQTLVPRADGSLSGEVTSTADCNGATVDLSQPLTLTPL